MIPYGPAAQVWLSTLRGFVSNLLMAALPVLDLRTRLLLLTAAGCTTIAAIAAEAIAPPCAQTFSFGLLAGAFGLQAGDALVADRYEAGTVVC